jgi:hypothetical protein
MSGDKGTYQFVGENSTQGFKDKAGRCKIEIGVRLDRRSDVSVVIGEVEVEVKPR